MAVKPSAVDLNHFGYRAWLTQMLILVHVASMHALIYTAILLIHYTQQINRKARP